MFRFRGGMVGEGAHPVTDEETEAVELRSLTHPMLANICGGLRASPRP